jgi:hypothetical protein
VIVLSALLLVRLFVYLVLVVPSLLDLIHQISIIAIRTRTAHRGIIVITHSKQGREKDRKSSENRESEGGREEEQKNALQRPRSKTTYPTPE